MDSCQELYQKLEEWKSALNKLNNLIEEYIKNPSEGLEKQIEKTKKEIVQKKEEYISTFEKVFIETEFTDLTGHRKKEKVFIQEAEALERIKEKIGKEPRIEMENGHIIVFSVRAHNLSHDVLYPALKDNIQFFTKLIVFDCYNNQLTSLPELPNSLSELYCSNNQLTSLPELPNSLTTLYCYNNQLTSLPELPNSLTTLDCTYNRLTSLPKLPSSLTTLYCYNNQLTSLPELPNSLTTLDCRNNQLTSLPELPNSLTTLDCRNNPLTEESKLNLEKLNKERPWIYF